MICIQCKKDKEQSEFRKRIWKTNQCRDCERENGRKRYYKNKESYSLKSLEWKKNNKERIREYKKIKYWQNPEKEREYKRRQYLSNPKMFIDNAIRWAKNNPEKKEEHNRNRRARKNNNGGHISRKEWQELKKKYNYTCLKCGRKEPEVKITLDHVVPLSLGGRHSIENAQPLCLSCNSSKKDKHIDYRS